MHPINSISHPEPLITEKVNFFADYYGFVVFQMGINSKFEIETLSSLFDKIIFQIEQNDPKHVMAYINNHLNNPILVNNEYFEESTHFEKISAHISNLKRVHKLNSTEQLKFLSQEKPVLLSDFKKFRTYLRRTEFRTAVKAAVSYLKCNHSLEEHKEDFKRQTRIIAATLFFSRKGKADILGVFNKIMSRDIFEFPFPQKLLDKHKSGSVQARKEFMKNRTFDQQFAGIVNFKENKETIKVFVFRIGNLEIEDIPLLVKFQNISLYSSGHAKIVEIKELIKGGAFVNFFSDRYDIYAIVNYDAYEGDRPHIRALKQLQGWVDEINFSIKSYAYIDKESYLITSDFLHYGGRLFHGETYLKKVKGGYVKRVSGANAVGKLESVRSKAKNQFILHEPLYLEARRGQDISKYWQYLENMLSMPLRTKVSKIASKKLIENDKAYLMEYLEKCFFLFNYPIERTGFSLEEARVAAREIKSSTVDLDKLSKRTHNAFIKELIAMVQMEDNSKPDSYINRLLTEIQECRNFQVHAGLSNQLSVLKLVTTVNSVLNPLRNTLIGTMKENPKLSFTEVIEYHTNKN